MADAGVPETPTSNAAAAAPQVSFLSRGLVEPVCFVVMKSLSAYGAADPHRIRDVDHSSMTPSLWQPMSRMFHESFVSRTPGEGAQDLLLAAET